jgi:RNA polymerase sigma factor (sigma-70 family)
MTQPTESLQGDPKERLLARARAGDEAAWEELFRTCYPKLIRAVRRKLDPPLRSLYDSTDFASDVMKSLAAKFGHLDFPSLDSLYAFLTKAAEQKVIDEHRRRHTLKRDISRERSLNAVGEGDRSATLPSPDPTASQVAQENEAHERLLARRTETERAVIEMKRQGYSTAEISDRTGWHIRKVQRFLDDLHESLDKPGDDIP